MFRVRGARCRFGPAAAGSHDYGPHRRCALLDQRRAQPSAGICPGRTRPPSPAARRRGDRRRRPNRDCRRHRAARRFETPCRKRLRRRLCRSRPTRQAPRRSDRRRVRLAGLPRLWTQGTPGTSGLARQPEWADQAQPCGARSGPALCPPPQTGPPARSRGRAPIAGPVPSIQLAPGPRLHLAGAGLIPGGLGHPDAEVGAEIRQPCSFGTPSFTSIATNCTSVSTP